MKKDIKLTFFGTPKFSATILNILISQYPNIFVITQPDKPVGRKQVLTPSPVKIVAKKHKIPFFDYRNSTSIIQIIKVKKPDLTIVAAFGKILPPEILKIPKFGCLGVHPSLLPKYRGPTPVQFAILNGEKETGVTIFLMDEKMDHGPIVAQRQWRFPISNFQFPNKSQAQMSPITSAALSEKLAQLGAELLIETIPKWIEGKIKPRPQNHKKATYTKLLTKKDGFVDWKKIALATQEKVGPSPESIKIERMVRAFTPWPGVWTEIKIKNKKSKIKNKRLKILKAHLEKSRLVLEQVQLGGKKPVSWKEFRQGLPKSALSAN